MNPFRAVALIGVLVLLAVAGCDDAPEESPPELAESPTPTPTEPAEPTPTPTPPPTPTPTPTEPEDEAQAPEAHAVNAGHPDAVDAGMAVLADGGTAVDAAVAAAYAVSVVEPFASGIGGGGATLVHEQGQEPEAYDYREVVAESGQIPQSNTGVPGFVAGLEALLEAHGTAERSDLFEPAITLARDGVTVSQMLAAQLESGAGRLPVSQLAHLYPHAAPLGAGDELVQDELATTLELIADGGAEPFYEGEIAADLHEHIAGLDSDTLAAYEVQTEPPVSGAFGDYELIGAAPALPGANVVQLLQIAESLGVADQSPGSADFVHDLAMSWRVAHEHLLWDVGDPAFVDVPTDELTDPERNAALAEQVPADGLVPIDTGQPRGGLDPNTTHITVADADGTVVSMTNTITNFWGSGQYIRGFFLNDQLARFSEGRGDANDPAPGKRSVTWSSPMLVADHEGRPVLGLGTPGGRRIPSILAGVLTRWGLHGEDLESVVAAPRFHLEGTVLEVEEPLGGDVVDSLTARGYAGVEQPPSPYHFGSVQALELDYDAGEILGAADTRREADWRVEAP